MNIDELMTTTLSTSLFSGAPIDASTGYEVLPVNKIELPGGGLSDYANAFKFQKRYGNMTNAQFAMVSDDELAEFGLFDNARKWADQAKADRTGVPVDQVKAEAAAEKQANADRKEAKRQARNAKAQQAGQNLRTTVDNVAATPGKIKDAVTETTDTVKRINTEKKQAISNISSPKAALNFLKGEIADTANAYKKTTTALSSAAQKGSAAIASGANTARLTAGAVRDGSTKVADAWGDAAASTTQAVKNKASDIDNAVRNVGSLSNNAPNRALGGSERRSLEAAKAQQVGGRVQQPQLKAGSGDKIIKAVTVTQSNGNVYTRNQQVLTDSFKAKVNETSKQLEQVIAKPVKPSASSIKTGGGYNVGSVKVEPVNGTSQAYKPGARVTDMVKNYGSYAGSNTGSNTGSKGVWKTASDLGSKLGSTIKSNKTATVGLALLAGAEAYNLYRNSRVVSSNNSTR